MNRMIKSLLVTIALCLNIQLTHGAIYIVTNNGDSGAGTFREMVDQSNLTIGVNDIIEFQSGIGPISLTSAPIIMTDRVHIAGQGQTITGSGMAALQLNVGSEGSTLTGLAILSSLTAIYINSDYHRIYGCAIGTDWANNGGLGNSNGITIVGNYNDIGGSRLSDRNIISGNISSGILILAGSSDNRGNRIRGNYIGLDSTGSNILANSIGITMAKGSANRIGGSRLLNDGEGNVISGNDNQGIYFQSTECFGNTICGNVVGLSADQSIILGNQSTGLLMYQGPSGNYIGLPSPGRENVFAGHDQYGINLWRGTTNDPESINNLFQNNFVGCNASSTAFTNGSYGFYLNNADNNVIGGNIANLERNVISGNSATASAGLYIIGHSNQVKGNFIGTDAAGVTAVPNRSGIILNGYSNLIGHVNNSGSLINGNVISGQIFSGIILAGGEGNTIAGNHIGLNRFGDTAVPNSGIGIHISASSGNNLIGGNNAVGLTIGNVISGNGGDGIRCDNGHNNTIAGNYIGLNRAGNALFGNGGRGMYLNSSTSNYTIGGSFPGMRNVIVGNTTEEIYMITTQSHDVIGNYIGTSADGLTTLGTIKGIHLFGTDDCHVGGINPGEGNLISTSSVGIQLSASSSGNTVVGNSVGVLADHSIQATSNSHGIYMFNSTFDNYIGLHGTGQGNLIAGWDNGIMVYSVCARNGLYGNTITAFTSEAIALYDATSNDNQATPTNIFADTTIVSGTAQANDFIEVFIAEGNTLTAGGSVSFFGSTTTDGSGHWQLASAGLSVGQLICTTASDSLNNTSSLSQNVEVMPIPATPTITPTSTAVITSSPTITLSPTISVTSTISATSTISPTITITSTTTPTMTASPTSGLANVDMKGKQLLAYPNPAKDSMNFLLDLNKSGSVKILVMNLSGEVVVTIEEQLSAGSGQALTWQFCNVAPGLYIVQLLIDGKLEETVKVAIIK